MRLNLVPSSGAIAALTFGVALGAMPYIVTNVRWGPALFWAAALVLSAGVWMRQVSRLARQTKSMNDRLKAVIDTSADAILVSDNTGRLLEFGGAAQDMFGMSAEEARGRQLVGILTPEGGGAGPAPQESRDMDQGPNRVQLEAEDTSGRTFPIEVSISETGTGADRIYVSFVRDISRRVHAEKALKAARDAARQSEKAMENLLTLMSHEMRTPLNGIVGALQLLDGPDLAENQRTYVEAMKTSADILLRHINSVLDASRDDHPVSKPKLFDLCDLVRTIAASQTAAATAAGNHLAVQVPSRPMVVNADPAILSQIVLNLVGNAIKFTENGRIDVAVTRKNSTAPVSLIVKDTGQGIDPGHLDDIFDDFVTLGTGTDRFANGTGLGLGIVKRLVENLGGSVSVSSWPEVGSEFTVNLPLAEHARQGSASTQSRLVESGTCQGANVLVVDDNEINRLICSEMVAQGGAKVQVAASGQEAISLANERPFDLILMDINMPGLDGIETTRAIQSGQGPNKATRIVALTAHSRPSDVERIRAAGLQGTIVKPLTKADLFGLFSGAERLEAPKYDPQNSPLARLVRKANHDLIGGLDDLLRPGSPLPRGKPRTNRIHELVGLAAVSNNSLAHAHLVRAETASAQSKLKEMRRALVAAQSALGRAESGAVF